LGLTSEQPMHFCEGKAEIIRVQSLQRLAMGCVTEGLEFKFNFYLSISSTLAVGSYQAPIQKVLGAFSLEVNWPPTRAEVDKTWIYTSIPHTSSWHSA
jgi:hypothetical protein